MVPGCYTAIVTPFKNNSVDYDGLLKLVDFQIENRVTGILAVGTTGESPTLSWEEHKKVIGEVTAKTKNKCISIAGTGSNNTKESIEATEYAARLGMNAVLMVDPYYNGPSSLEIRKEYIEPVAVAFPEIEIIPYIIPGRTGAQMLPEDIAILNRNFKNITTVKEATGNIENMKRTRECCGSDFIILSGDDAMVFQMMTDLDIKAAGVVSVVSNIAPGAVTKMVSFLEQGKPAKAEKLHAALMPLFELVTIKTREITPFGEVECRARNPLAIKTLMSILGMPSGGCRRPMGKMTKAGAEKVLKTAQKLYSANPEILKPVADFFDIDIASRLKSPSIIKGLYYDSYS